MAHGQQDLVQHNCTLLSPGELMERAVRIIVVLAWQRWVGGGRGWGEGT